MCPGAAVTGWGGALPPTAVPNAVFEADLDTTDEWIVSRTGIRSRHVGSTVGALSTAAGRAALEQAGVDPGSVDLLVLATTTPDQVMPSTAATVHHELGLGGGAFDVNAACSGFIYALLAAYGAIASGVVDRALVVGADIMSSIVDPADRSTVVLFGDGAGALLLDRAAVDGQFLGWDLGTDGSAHELLQVDHGGKITMDGKEVYRRAIRATVASAFAALEQSKLRADEIALFVPHQANLRIIEAVAERIGIPVDRTAVMVDRTGNTSAASIPLALAEAADAGRIAPGDAVLVSGFGAGMTWGSTVFRWGI